MKAISAVIATVMLLMTTVSLIGVFYVFSSTLATQTTSSGGQQASQLTSQLSMCMQIDNIIGNQVTLRNCGEGVIENKSLVVMMDDIVLGANTNTIQEGNSSVVNVSGLWQVPFGKHSLKISNGAAVALALVDVQPNPEGLAGSWNFDEGSGGNAYDSSGNGNVGTLTNMNTTGNATSGWSDGKFGEWLQFDGVNDYVNVVNSASLNITNAITMSAWVKPTILAQASNPEIMAKGGSSNNYRIRYSSDGSISGKFYGTSNNSISSNSSLNVNTFSHVAFVYDGSYNYAYFNGVLDKPREANGGNILITIDKLTIGSLMGSNEFFNGTIDEVRIWNQALSPDETVVMKKII
ncbi:MAG: LamG domain-containing protein [Candidatus Aenigmatarchaeota archaeon]